MKNHPRKSPPSQEDLEDAARLKKAYKAAKFQARERGESLTQDVIAHQCGWSGQSAVSQFMNGTTALSLNALLKLSAVLSVPPESISPRFSGLLSAELELKDLTRSGGKSLLEKYLLVPRLGSANAEDSIQAFKAGWFYDKTVDISSTRYIEADNNSMSPFIEAGDIVLLDTSQKKPEDNRVFAIDHGGQVTLKRLFWQASGNLMLSSDNPAFPKDVVRATDLHKLQVVGKMIWRGG